MFTGFQMEDYWLITAAQRVATGRLYPQIRTFFDDLTVALAADGIDWSQPSYKGMWLGGASTSVSKPSDWTRSYVGAPYWPEAWPKRGTAKSAANLALYAIFDFLNPAVEVETVAVQQVREALAGIQNACRAVPALWAALAKTSQIAGALSETAPETSAEAVQHSNTATP